MKKWFFFLFFWTTLGFASEILLKERFAFAEAGSYVVTEQSKSFTFLYVNRVQKGRLILEEVSIPASRFSSYKLSWRDWFEKGAPGHTSWLISQINLETACFEETFSFTHRGWVDLTEGNSFLTTLLNLRFQQVSDKERRRVGLPPGHGKPDHRRLWNPRLIVEGKPISIPFTVWKTRWPQDGSELSRKFLEIYLPEEGAYADGACANLPKFPLFFPYWIEIDGKIGSMKLRVVDSGINVRSPQAGLPLRHFEIVKENQETTEGLQFHLKSPTYYQEFMIVAESEDSFGKIIPLPCKTFTKENDVLILIPKEELKTLTSGEKYHFLIRAKENPSLCLETKKPYIYKQNF